MYEGLYTSFERVERDGRLVAFAGEVMSMAEAARRGLLPEDKPEAEPEQEPEDKPEAEPEAGPGDKPKGGKKAK